MTNTLNIILQTSNNQPVANSRQVAEHFGKEPRNVLQSIRNLIAENPAVKNMFYETTYINERGREYPEFLMNKNGFTLLVMGFTGEKALEFKLAYINAFDEMEKMIKNSTPQLSQKEQLLLDLFNSDKTVVAASHQALVELEVEEATAPLIEIIEEQQPKIEYVDTILASKETVSITQIAKDYGMSGMMLNRVLSTLRVQFKQRNQWFLYAKHHNKQYTQSITFEANGRVVSTTHWTQKGRLFIHNLLEQNGIYANIEAPKEYDVKMVVKALLEPDEDLPLE